MSAQAKGYALFHGGMSARYCITSLDSFTGTKSARKITAAGSAKPADEYAWVAPLWMIGIIPEFPAADSTDAALRRLERRVDVSNIASDRVSAKALGLTTLCAEAGGPDRKAYLKPSHRDLVAKYTGNATATPSGTLCSAIATARLSPTAWLFMDARNTATPSGKLCSAMPAPEHRRTPLRAADAHSSPFLQCPETLRDASKWVCGQVVSMVPFVARRSCCGAWLYAADSTLAKRLRNAMHLWR